MWDTRYVYIRYVHLGTYTHDQYLTSIYLPNIRIYIGICMNASAQYLTLHFKYTYQTYKSNIQISNLSSHIKCTHTQDLTSIYRIYVYTLASIWMHRHGIWWRFLMRLLQHTIFPRSVTRQHTATHCNILQYTATHRNTASGGGSSCVWRSTRFFWGQPYGNTLQHTATHCNTLQHNATHCSMPRTAMHQCVTVCCSVLPYDW